MKVVILCGGQGTRIRDISDQIPKPMVAIGRYPILWHIMKIYASYGYTEFVLCLGYKGDAIKNFFLNYESYTRDITITLGDNNLITYHNEHSETNWTITFADTGLDSMTGHRIKRIQKYIQNQDFMLTYGDGVGNIDIKSLVEYHYNHNCLLTVTGVRPPGRFGELNYTSGLLSEFNEKPQATGGRISGGFFVARPDIFDYLNDDQLLVFEQEPMSQLVIDRQVMVYEHDGFWHPMDTSRDYKFLNSLYQDGRAPWVCW